MSPSSVTRNSSVKERSHTGRSVKYLSPEDEAAERKRRRLKLFPFSELEETSDEKDLDKQVVIRFPPDVASKLRERLGCENTQLGLGLTISPMADEDFRLFDVSFEEKISDPLSVKKLRGVLVELPTLIESYKTLDGDMLFKSADVSQMIVCYEPSKESFDVKNLKEKKNWEWSSGVTPSTRHIRTRKFRNFENFSEAEIQLGEQEILEMLRNSVRDKVYFETSTLYQLEEQRSHLASNTLPNNVTVVAPDANIFDDYEDIDSDVSDKLFQEVHLSKDNADSVDFESAVGLDDDETMYDLPTPPNGQAEPLTSYYHTPVRNPEQGYGNDLSMYHYDLQYSTPSYYDMKDRSHSDSVGHDNRDKKKDKKAKKLKKKHRHESSESSAVMDSASSHHSQQTNQMFHEHQQPHSSAPSLPSSAMRFTNEYGGDDRAAPPHSMQQQYDRQYYESI